MINEFEKIAAVKSRHGSVPIRVHNLSNRSEVDKSDGGLKTKTAAPKIPKGILGRHGKTMGLIGGSLAAWETGKQSLRDWQLGRAIRKQQEQRQG